MVRIAVVLALAVAAEGARSNVQVVDAELAAEEVEADLEDTDFNYEVADALDWDAELAAGDYTFEASAGVETNETQVGGWQCHTGQGGAGQAIQNLPLNNMQACSMACAQNFQCAAFDFTSWMNNDACRFYTRGNNVRYNGGVHNRQYCHHTAAWLSSHSNWRAGYQTGGVGGYNPGYPATNPGMVNPGFANPGFANPGFGQSAGGWVCQPGQGRGGESIQRTPFNNLQQCSMACAQNIQCSSFDYTTNPRQTACRLYGAGARQRNNPGRHNRQYCYHTAAWLSSHSNWRTGYQTGGVYAPGYPAGGGFAGQPAFGNGEYIIADGCSRSQGQQRARTRNALTGRASVRCCSFNGRRCETQTVGCMAGVSYSEAAGACASRGLRLCSQQELNRGVCCGTGCGFDGRRVWTNTPAR